MEKFLLDKLGIISEEEQAILTGKELNKKLYTSEGEFIVNIQRLNKERDISVRTHTRFVDFPNHKHNYLEIMVVLKGCITHCIGGENISLNTSDFLVMNKHTTHSILKAGKDDIGVNIIISDGFINSLASELDGTVFSELILENSKEEGDGIYLSFSSKNDKQIENIVENLLFELTEYKPDMQIMRRTVALLFTYLSLKSSKLLRIANRLPDRITMRKKQIADYISSSYKTASLSELCEKMYLSAPYLSKLISEYFGKGFKELLLETRIKKATELLTTTNLSVGDIIQSIGYETESYFHREFKAQTGLSPLSFRRKNKEY